MNVGTPHTSWLVDERRCAPSRPSPAGDRCRPRPTRRRRRHRRPRARRSRSARSGAAPAATWRCSNSAWWASRNCSGCVSRIAIDDLQGDDAGVLLGLLPHRRLALLDVGLTERERQERDVPVGAGPQAGHDVVVDDAGARAAVVEGQAELSGHGERQPPRRRPDDSRPAQDAPGGEAEAGADGHPGDDVGRVVDAHVRPAVADRSSPAPTTAAPSACRPTTSAATAANAAALGVPGRERRRQRPAHRVAGVTLGGRPRPAEQPLDALVDEQALGAEGERQHRHLVGAPVAGRGRGRR